MFAKPRSRGKSDSFRRVGTRKLSMEPLEDRRVLDSSGLCYVDANDNGSFDGGDVALTKGEVEDGFFDTRIAEGGYSSVIAGAGLVIDGDPISGPNLTYKSEGGLLVKTDLESREDIRLVSRFRSVVVHNTALTAGDDVFLWARRDILNDFTAVRATGDSSKISLRALRDFSLQGAEFLAPHGKSDIRVHAGRNLFQRNATFQAGRGVKMYVGGDANVSLSTVRAGK
jgi:hypothetical protein